MTINNLGGVSAQTSSVTRASQVREERSGGRKSVDDVLASLREMMPGWTISTSTSDWGEGVRNIQIDRDILQRMADDPREMERVKSMIRDFESAATELEQWKEQNPGQSFEVGISLDSDGQARALIKLITQAGDERSTTFELPSDRNAWAGFMREHLEALSQGQTGAAGESRSWTA